MTKKEYLKEWGQKIQNNIWEREVFLAFKEQDENALETDKQALKYNNEKDQSLLDFINKISKE